MNRFSPGCCGCGPTADPVGGCFCGACAYREVVPNLLWASLLRSPRCCAPNLAPGMYAACQSGSSWDTEGSACAYQFGGPAWEKSRVAIGFRCVGYRVVMTIVWSLGYFLGGENGGFVLWSAVGGTIEGKVLSCNPFSAQFNADIVPLDPPPPSTYGPALCDQLCPGFLSPGVWDILVTELV